MRQKSPNPSYIHGRKFYFQGAFSLPAAGRLRECFFGFGIRPKKEGGPRRWRAADPGMTPPA